MKKATYLIAMSLTTLAAMACEGTIEGSPTEEVVRGIRAQPGEPPPTTDDAPPPPRGGQTAGLCYHAELRARGTMRYAIHSGASAGFDIFIDVVNVGTGTTTGGADESRVSIDGTVYPAASIHGYGSPEGIIAPNANGFVELDGIAIPLAQCQGHTVQVDLDHRWTSWPELPPAARALTPCPLHWSQPITPVQMGIDPDPLAALAANPTAASAGAPSSPTGPSIYGLSLQDIVNSRALGTTLGLCVNCHNAAEGKKDSPMSRYNPDDAHWGLSGVTIEEGSNIAGLTWSSGWGTRFLAALPYGKPKYEPLRQAVAKWLADGALP
jgi:hypothetical protein